MKRTLVLMTLLALTCGAFAAAKVGKPSPDFTGTDIDGKTHNLSDYKGKIVVLEAYNLDCPYVKNHYKTGALPELQQELTGDGVVWLVVNSVSKNNPSYRTPEKAKKEMEGIKATAWIDDNAGTIGKAYGMRTTPHMYVIDKDGVLAYQGALDDKPAPSGDPRKARNYVREAVQKLKAGERPTVAETKPYGCGVKY
jgi:peroxiredoxin